MLAAAALLLPILTVVLVGTARLLAAMQDLAGAAAVDRVALGVGILWVTDLIALVIVQAIHLRAGRSNSLPRRRFPRPALPGSALLGCCNWSRFGGSPRPMLTTIILCCLPILSLAGALLILARPRASRSTERPLVGPGFVECRRVLAKFGGELGSTGWHEVWVACRGWSVGHVKS